MKKSILAIVALCVAFFAGSGCATTSSVTALPLVAEIAQARIAVAILDRSPERADALLAVATAIEGLSAETQSGEISEALIRTWVARHTEDLGLFPTEQELLVSGLLMARDAFLSKTGSVTLDLADERLQPWLTAIQRGIRTGVAMHAAK